MTTFTARSPLDLVAVVPFVLGFHPEDSVVLLTFGPGECFHARVALPVEEPAQEQLSAMLADLAVRRGVAQVALVLYTDDAEAAARFHDIAVTELVGEGVEVIDVIRVDGGRFHAACDRDDPGTAYDLTCHRFTAEQVLEGRVAHPSRADLAASIEPADTDDARAVEAAALAFGERSEGPPQLARADRIRHDLAAEARWMQRTIRRHVRLGTALSVQDAARLLVLLLDTPLRDVAWAEISRDDAAKHVELWRDLVRRCPRALVPAASSLLAFAAWLCGNGALSWCALDRCAEVDPDYSLASCIAGLLEGAVPPSAWSAVGEDELAALWPEPPGEAS